MCDITSISKITVAPGDMFVIKVPMTMALESGKSCAQSFADALKKSGFDNLVMMIHGDLEISVISKPEQAE